VQTELDQAKKELEKTTAQIDLERQDLKAKLATAENNFEKAKLKQRIGAINVSSRDIVLDELAVEQARREVEALRERMEWHKKASEATYNIIVGKQKRAEAKVNEIKEGLDRFQIKADRDGVVVHKTKWNNERFKVGETVWSGQSVVEIPDLNTIIAAAFVPEVDLGKIKMGQRAEITIDAFPGKSYLGTIKGLGRLVRPKSWDIPNKVLDVEITLDQLDTSMMRPAMSIKAKIETGSITDCLAVPLKAVRNTAEGATVKVRTEQGWREQSVKLGDSNGVEVVITEGVKAGDRIAADYSKAK
jgi:HlyD family secretion protein